METIEDHVSTDIIHEFERRNDELEKRFIGKREAAANEKPEVNERQHTTTTATKREEMIGEAEQQQHAAVTAVHREDMNDGTDQELLAPIEKSWKARAKEISMKIKKRESDTIKDQRDMIRYRTFLKCLKKSNRWRIPRKKILVTHMRNEVGDIEASRKGIANTFCKTLQRSGLKSER